MNLHPFEKPLAEFVERILGRLGLGFLRQFQPSSCSEVVVFEVVMIGTDRDSDLLRFLPFNANTPARCPRRRLLFAEAFVSLADLHIPSSQDGASSPSGATFTLLFVAISSDGGSFELPATSTQNDPSACTLTAPG
ncbi:hypothetical protein E4Z66_11515 [Aliishimia ponticola]|uniref:Uncharacterized protein n=1 Tax=Aliishimia ponticola TaxID=2499833 RepID=A0A4S4N975_9RHOB|nr:hypothetical protein [Aliishimia ponticola]THH35709.1 hypothetical protein E4Z66_11515 [Aliishimia ponticola]